MSAKKSIHLMVRFSSSITVAGANVEKSTVRQAHALPRINRAGCLMHFSRQAVAGTGEAVTGTHAPTTHIAVERSRMGGSVNRI